MTFIGILLALSMLNGPGTPDNYPPKPPSGTNGPAQPRRTC